MQVDLKQFIKKEETIAVATSGGSDSMALLDFMLSNSKKLNFNVIAINVEHGIRGQESIDDSNFVKDYCNKRSIPLITYSVDSLKKAREDKLSVEQAARTLRYECFFDAISKGKCDKVATAHHLSDNFESVLFNLFRGTGLTGLCGIEQNFEDKIIRPFLNVDKKDILEYIQKSGIPFVVDQTNFDDDYTRNFIRLNVIPQIKKVFPEAEKSILRLTEIVKTENEYLSLQAEKAVSIIDNTAQISLPNHPAIISRATIIALKQLGVKKDWEKTHVDSVCELCNKSNGAQLNLLDQVIAVKEYDKITLYRKTQPPNCVLPFALGESVLDGQKVNILEEKGDVDLKSGLYGDKAKIPATATIRYRKNDDVFTKFGGGTKNLNDYFTDIKLPARQRDFVPVLADGNQILVVFGIAVSNKIKVDKDTKSILKFE